MSAKPVFDAAALNSGAKGLNTVQKSAKADLGFELPPEQVKAMEELYERHNGDLDAIFGELKANPTKAKKPHNMPKSASEFARKYLQGFYELVGDADVAESKNGDSGASAKGEK